MKLRKFMAVALAMVLGAASVLPAMAAEAAAGSDQALMAVTAKVKSTLGLDTEVFDDFQGWADEDVLLGKRWNLEWNGDGVSLRITADDNGKIYSYNRSETVSDPVIMESRYFGGKLNIPRLPEDKSAAAYGAAVDFVGKVLEAPVETLEMENRYSPSLEQSVYRYSGNILLNGLDSPIRCSVSVRASDLTVIRFWRSDEGAGYLNGVGAKVNNTTDAQARFALQGTLEFEAQFVLDDQGKTAHVRYVPLYRDDYYVDGETGKLVNLTELRKKLWEGGSANNKLMYTTNGSMMDMGAPEAAMDTAAGLTQAEKDGAAILEGALSKEVLDRTVQNAWPEFGLERYTLSGANYSISKKALPQGQEATAEDYDITCRLTYGKQEGQVLRNKYVTVDAKTGTVKSLWSRRYFQGEGEETLRYVDTLTTAQPKAESVLKSFAGANFASLALAASTDAQKPERHDWQHTYTFQHKAGDWFYSGNSYTVGVDATDGTISQLDGSFDPEVELVVPKSIVTPKEAAAAYAAAMDLSFAYLEVPVSISLAGGDVMPLLKQAGYSYVLALKTGYTLVQPKNKYVRAVDAESGQAVVDVYENVPDNAITYDDLDGHWVQTAARELAVFSIGLRGGSLKPQQILTQLDMISLLASVEGYAYDPATATKDDTDWLYNRAYSLGLVTPETRDETRAVTRGELVKLILDSAGYQRVAALVGIFRCDFSDSASIGAQDLGYAALAQGLGLVKGGEDGAYAAGREATRAEAIAMLYQYMK